jgi:hypothetical protein
MSRGAARLRGGGLDRLDDALVAGAAAEDGGEALTNLGLGRSGIGLEQISAVSSMPGVQKPH